MPSEISMSGADQVRRRTPEELERELAEAREQQAATAQILAAISKSPSDRYHVFQAIAESAGRLCNANDATIFQVAGDSLRLIAHHGPIPTTDTLSLTRRLPSGCSVLDRRTIQVANLQAEIDEFPEGSENAKRLGFCTLLAVPLIGAGQAIGVIAIRRTEARPFTVGQINLLKTFADQALIAIENTRLFEELQARTKELTESLEYQTATSEVLSVISKSPNNLQPVLDAIVVTAQRLCQAEYALFWKREDDSFYHNKASVSADVQFVDWTRAHPIAAGDGSMVGIVAAERQTMHFPDCLAEPRFTDLARNQQSRARTMLGVPLLRGGDAIGVIFLARTVVRPFTDRQIALVTTFANQAVIAIENARLFEAEQARTNELKESLEHQTAASAVLNVISRSKSDVQPVFDAIVRSAAELFDPCAATITTREGSQILWRASAARHNVDRLEQMARTAFPVPFDPERSPSARAMLEKRIIEIPDVSALERNAVSPAAKEFTRSLQVAGVRSIAFVPMLHTDEGIGTIILGHPEPGFRLSQKQRALVQTFADQAVIAIENARLFEEVQARTRELSESLEYQTATSDVLGVISRSPSQLQPVADAIVQTAKRLCSAERATMWRWREGKFDLLAHTISDPVLAKYLKDNPIPSDRASLAGRAVLEGRTMHVPDLRADPELRLQDQAIIGRIRTLLVVPLLRKGEAIGVLSLSKSEVQPFSEKQIELVTTFADQAVIAIENTRLFEAEQASKRELTEALEQQTATADVLKVISRSALDVQKVLDALVESAARLCDAYDAIILQLFGDSLRLVAHHGQIPLAGPVGQLTIPVERGSIGARAVIDRRTIQVADMLAEADEYPQSWQRALQLSYRAALAVPLVHAGEAIGVILIRRAEVRPFTERQIELVNTFADQAVIAIENTRLFAEVQVRTRELAKTVEDLEIASQHKNQFVANMSHELRTPLAAILGYAELIQEGFYEPQGPKSLDALTRIRSNGKHLLGLINTVLDIAKIESGQFTLNMAEYAIESVVETVRAATESLAQNKKLTLTTSVDKSLPVGLGDEQRITQVLLNLVGNAIKFTEAGEVRVTAKAVNGHFNISVTDTGPGIPTEHQIRIFEQFHQVDSSNTKAKGGTGLGLAIAKEIVEMHGGRIWVESTVGTGSTFQMEIPARAQEARSV